MFRWSAANQSTRCTAPIFLRSRWATATIRRMLPGLFAFLDCPRDRGRGLVWRSADEDVVRKVPAATGSGFRALAAVVQLRSPAVEVRTHGQQRARPGAEGRRRSVVGRTDRNPAGAEAARRQGSDVA